MTNLTLQYTFVFYHSDRKESFLTNIYHGHYGQVERAREQIADENDVSESGLEYVAVLEGVRDSRQDSVTNYVFQTEDGDGVVVSYTDSWRGRSPKESAAEEHGCDPSTLTRIATVETNQVPTE